MKMRNKLFKVISLMLIVTMLIPTDLLFAKNKTFKTHILEHYIDGYVYSEDASNLKVGDTNTYRFKIDGYGQGYNPKNKAKMLMTFRAEDTDAYSITLRDNKNKVIASNNSCKKTWTKKFTMSEKATYKVEVKALKESVFTLDIALGNGESYVIKKYGKEKDFTMFNMGYAYRNEGSYITAPVSGGRWIQMIDHTVYYSFDDSYKISEGKKKDASYTQFKTLSKSKKYKITKDSPSEAKDDPTIFFDGAYMFYLKDQYLFKYYLQDLQGEYCDNMCDEIYDYDAWIGAYDDKLYLTINCVNKSDKTLKEVVYNLVVYDGEDLSVKEKCKLSIPIVVFSGQLREKTVDVTKKLEKYPLNFWGLYIESIKFVYTDGSSKVYDSDDLDDHYLNFAKHLI